MYRIAIPSNFSNESYNKRPTFQIIFKKDVSNRESLRRDPKKGIPKLESVENFWKKLYLKGDRSKKVCEKLYRKRNLFEGDGQKLYQKGTRFAPIRKKIYRKRNLWEGTR